nr:hypothetical protein [Polymorphobacter sp.]
MHNRPSRFARTNLVWVIGIAAGILVGGIVAYGVSSSNAETTISR